LSFLVAIDHYSSLLVILITFYHLGNYSSLLAIVFHHFWSI